MPLNEDNDRAIIECFRTYVRTYVRRATVHSSVLFTR